MELYKIWKYIFLNLSTLNMHWNINDTTVAKKEKKEKENRWIF